MRPISSNPVERQPRSPNGSIERSDVSGGVTAALCHMHIEADPRFHAALPTVQTVLFSDVVRSTALIDERGEQTWLDLVDHHARTVAACAAAHNGSVATFLGDGFMVLFDDPADAVACAVDLQVRSATEDLPGLRIGLDHGEIHAFRDEWWIGLTIHVASRLTVLCRNREILVSDRCLRAAALPACEPVVTRVEYVKGMCEPCLVHVIAPLGAASSRQPIARPMASSSP